MCADSRQPNMKIFCKTLCGLLSMGFPLQAQEPELTLLPLPAQTQASSSDEEEADGYAGKNPKWQFGITAGYFHSTTAWIVTGAGVEYSAKDHLRSHPGFTAGFAASYPFAEVWSLDTGINLSMWGFGYKSGGISVRSDRYAFEVPLLITFFEKEAYIPVFLQAGLLGGFTAGGVNNVALSSGETAERPALKSAFNRFSFGLVIGIGYGHFTFQFINNLTNVWNRDMSQRWEELTGQTVDSQTSRAYSLTYTYWF